MDLPQGNNGIDEIQNLRNRIQKRNIIGSFLSEDPISTGFLVDVIEQVPDKEI